MNNEKFQELVLKKLDKIDELCERQDSFEKVQNLVLKKVGSLDERVSSVEEKVSSLDEKVSSLEEKVSSLDKRQSNLECDFKFMFKMMEKISEGLERVEGIVVRIENENNKKVRGLFEKYDIHEKRIDNHELRLARLESK